MELTKEQEAALTKLLDREMGREQREEDLAAVEAALKAELDKMEAALAAARAATEDEIQRLYSESLVMQKQQSDAINAVELAYQQSIADKRQDVEDKRKLLAATSAAETSK